MSSLSADQVKYLDTGYWGLLVSSILLGCSLVQGYNYFHDYNDRWYLKAMVWTMLALNIMSWGLLAKISYFYLVQNYNDPSELSILLWEYGAVTTIVYVIQALAQLFFAHQIYAVSSRKAWIVAAFIVFLAVLGLGCGLALAILLATHKSLSYIDSKPLNMMAEVCMAVPTVCDVTATIAMWYFLDSMGRGFKKTDSTIQSLKFLILNRGLLLVSMQGVMLILWIVAQSSWYWLPFHMNTVNIYVNTTLVMLNERTKIREKEKRIGTMSFQLGTRNQLSLRFNPIISLSQQVMTQDLEESEGELHNLGNGKTAHCIPEAESSGATLHKPEFDLTTNRRGNPRGGPDQPSPHSNGEVVTGRATPTAS